MPHRDYSIFACHACARSDLSYLSSLRKVLVPPQVPRFMSFRSLVHAKYHEDSITISALQTLRHSRPVLGDGAAANYASKQVGYPQLSAEVLRLPRPRLWSHGAASCPIPKMTMLESHERALLGHVHVVAESARNVSGCNFASHGTAHISTLYAIGSVLGRPVAWHERLREDHPDISTRGKSIAIEESKCKAHSSIAGSQARGVLVLTDISGAGYLACRSARTSPMI
ncbi:hypothetical protein OH77DRAFT_927834 [Trametes cingulata]|nr:hypothetical protein OH77DRAFT_927834 [Trametes cingulata]